MTVREHEPIRREHEPGAAAGRPLRPHFQVHDGGADALDGATPLPGTAYKVGIARALIRRALAGIGEPTR